MLNWIKGPYVFGLELWFAKTNSFQYVLSYEPETSEFRVSVKQYPNSGKREDFGPYLTEADAKEAAETHYSKGHQ